MFASRGSRAFARAALLATAAFVAASPAVAKKAARASAGAGYDASSLIPIPKFSGTSGRDAAPSMPQAPARYFTINSALARSDSGRPADEPVRLAVTPPNGNVATDAGQPALVKSTPQDEPFGMHAFRAPEGVLWSKWRTLEREWQVENARLKACESDPSNCGSEGAKFASLVAQAKAMSGRGKLERINQLVNGAIAYASDLTLHGELDRWSAPLATLARGRGDCEDYAILKRQVLIEAGVDPKDLRIVLVRDTSIRIDHAVLSARADGQWYVLDNRRSGFYVERDLPHYMPLFALDQGGVKLFAAPYAARVLGTAADAVQPGLNDDQDTAGGVPSLPLLL